MVFKPRLTREEELEICKRYEAGESSLRLADTYSYSSMGIRKILIRHDIPRRSKNEHALSPKQEEQVCQKYRDDLSTLQLAKEYSVSVATIRNILIRHGVARKCLAEAHRQFNCDHNFFNDIDNEEKAYWLGFLAADGYIYVPNDCSSIQITLSLHIRDLDHLKKFKSALQTDYPIRTYHPKGQSPRAVISMRSNPLAKALRAYGIVQAKSKSLPFPELLSPSLLRDFVRGYVDGDGSIVVYRDKDQYFNYGFQVAGNKDFLKDLQSYLMKACQLNRTKFSNFGFKNKQFATMTYRGRLQVRRIVKFLYKDANVYLSRKYKIVLGILESPATDKRRNIASNI